MKNLSFALILLSLSFSSFANESGSGNGNLNREVVEYQTKLNSAKLQLSTLEESFIKLQTELAKLNQSTIPTVTVATEDFWQSFTEQDRQVVLRTDASLIDLMERSLKIIPQVKEDVASAQAFLNALKKEAPHYQERGLDSKFHERLKTLQSKLNSSFVLGMRVMMNKLSDPFNVTLTIELTDPFQSYVSGQMYSCVSPTCVDLIAKKNRDYFNLVDKIGKSKINFLDIHGTVDEIANSNVDTFFIVPFKRQKKAFLNRVENARFDRIQELNEAIIK